MTSYAVRFRNLNEFGIPARTLFAAAVASVLEITVRRHIDGVGNVAGNAVQPIDVPVYHRFRLLKSHRVRMERMIENIYATYGVIFSGRFVNKLVEKGLSREEAYDLIQPLALRSYNERIMFKELLLKDQKLMSIMNADEIEDCFDLAYHLRHVDDILKRVGIM